MLGLIGLVQDIRCFRRLNIIYTGLQKNNTQYSGQFYSFFSEFTDGLAAVKPCNHVKHKQIPVLETWI